MKYPFLFQLVSRWSYRGPLRDKRCIHINIPTKSGHEAWNQSYLCWPHDGNYKFKWLTHAPNDEEKASCLKWTEPRDRTWNDSRYYLCAKKHRKPIGRLFHQNPLPGRDWRKRRLEWARYVARRSERYYYFSRLTPGACPFSRVLRVLFLASPTCMKWLM